MNSVEKDRLLETIKVVNNKVLILEIVKIVTEYNAEMERRIMESLAHNEKLDIENTGKVFMDLIDVINEKYEIKKR